MRSEEDWYEQDYSSDRTSVNVPIDTISSLRKVEYQEFPGFRVEIGEDADIFVDEEEEETVSQLITRWNMEIALEKEQKQAKKEVKKEEPRVMAQPEVLERQYVEIPVSYPYKGVVGQASENSKGKEVLQQMDDLYFAESFRDPVEELIKKNEIWLKSRFGDDWEKGLQAVEAKLGIELDCAPVKIGQEGVCILPRDCWIEEEVRACPIKKEDISEKTIEAVAEQHKAQSDVSRTERELIVHNRYLLREDTNYKFLQSLFYACYGMFDHMEEKYANSWRRTVAYNWQALLNMLEYGVDVVYLEYGYDEEFEMVQKVLYDRALIPAHVIANNYYSMRQEGDLSSQAQNFQLSTRRKTYNVLVDLLVEYVHVSEYRTWRLVDKFSYECVRRNLQYREDILREQREEYFVWRGYYRYPFFGCSCFVKPKKRFDNCRVCVRKKEDYIEKWAIHNQVLQEQWVLPIDKTLIRMYEFFDECEVDDRYLGKLCQHIRDGYNAEIPVSLLSYFVLCDYPMWRAGYSVKRSALSSVLAGVLTAKRYGFGAGYTSAIKRNGFNYRKGVRWK